MGESRRPLRPFPPSNALEMLPRVKAALWPPLSRASLPNPFSSAAVAVRPPTPPSSALKRSAESSHAGVVEEGGRVGAAEAPLGPASEEA